MNTPTAVRRPRGFTLVEMLVTISVMAILLAIGVPSFQTFVANQRLKSVSTELMAAMVMARSEAVKRNGTVNVTPVSSSAWASGWSVKVGTTALHTQEAVEGVTVTTMNAGCTAGASLDSVDFGANGRPGASSCFRITGSTTSARCVKVDLTGIPSSGTC